MPYEMTTEDVRDLIVEQYFLRRENERLVARVAELDPPADPDEAGLKAYGDRVAQLHQDREAM